MVYLLFRDQYMSLYNGENVKIMLEWNKSHKKICLNLIFACCQWTRGEPDWHSPFWFLRKAHSQQYGVGWKDMNVQIGSEITEEL